MILPPRLSESVGIFHNLPVRPDFFTTAGARLRGLWIGRCIGSSRVAGYPDTNGKRMALDKPYWPAGHVLR